MLLFSNKNFQYQKFLGKSRTSLGRENLWKKSAWIFNFLICTSTIIRSQRHSEYLWLLFSLKLNSLISVDLLIFTINARSRFVRNYKAHPDVCRWQHPIQWMFMHRLSLFHEISFSYVGCLSVCQTSFFERRPDY